MAVAYLALYFFQWESGFLDLVTIYEYYILKTWILVILLVLYVASIIVDDAATTRPTRGFDISHVTLMNV
jgi:hypothetical protein